MPASGGSRRRIRRVVVALAWQDIVLAAGGFVLTFGIIPTLRAPVKPPLLTTLTFVGVLSASCVAFVTLGLWLTAVGVGLQGILWSTVLTQTLLARRAAAALTRPVVVTPELGFEEYRASE